ncbi:protein ALP1-like [Pistacia vera]|uniref:protein ALP1-like n=1 Tax=Pistacia vera TaxID=55513 RepID=UPI0012633446|nr:protein ALP1-like [Pistacia vera]XP_031280868.1 protein ALP1-like [Pistacia vera]
MAAGGKKPKTATTTAAKKQKSKHFTPELLSLISAATSAAQSFLLHNDIHLLPSQILSLESLFSSLSSHFPSLPPSLPTYPSFFPSFLSTFSNPSDLQWLRFFRMSHHTFSHLLSLLFPVLSSSLPSFPPDAALAATLFRLSHGASYKSLARRFGFPSSADACRVFYTVCKGINEKLGNLVDFRDNLGRIVVGFGWISLPNCCGVLGFGSFGVEGELLGKNGSLLVQALVDSEGRFLDISAGWPSTVRPESVLHQSKLFSGVEESREFLNGPAYELGDGNLIPQYILGDSCFPLLPWLITPYMRSNEEDSFGSAEKEFNAVHSRAMGLVGAALGSVKARWQLLGKKWKEECVEFFPFVIVTGCLLHNFLIKYSEPMPDDDVVCLKEEELPVYEGEVDDNGRRIRDTLAEHLSRVSLRR